MGIIKQKSGKGIQCFFKHRNRCEVLIWKGATMDLKKTTIFFSPKVSFLDFMCFFFVWWWGGGMGSNVKDFSRSLL